MVTRRCLLTHWVQSYPVVNSVSLCLAVEWYIVVYAACRYKRCQKGWFSGIAGLKTDVGGGMETHISHTVFSCLPLRLNSDCLSGFQVKSFIFRSRYDAVLLEVSQSVRGPCFEFTNDLFLFSKAF